VKDISRSDISKLEGLCDEYKAVLEKYQQYTEILQERIVKLVDMG